MKYVIMLLTLSGFLAVGQLKLNTEKSTLMITGTSSLHDWEMVVNTFDATGNISASSVENLKVTVVAKSMKSGKAIMDNKAYDAVKAEEYEHIMFKAPSLKIVNGKIQGLGTVSLAGKSKSVDFSAQILSNSAGEMHLKGQLPLKMSDFDIEPPTAMFGTLKTGDEVVINYEIFISK
ncbi:MAG: hypothetical protein Tsb0034_03460 [Ekhidna sp.]